MIRYIYDVLSLNNSKFGDLGWFGLVYGVQQYFSNITVVSFIGGGNRSTRRKPPTCRKSLTNKFGDFVYRPYPIELERKDVTDTAKCVSYLYLHLEIDSNCR